jgi:hypothetical protein
VIHDNMINGTNHIVVHVFVDISRSQGCKNVTCQHEKKRKENNRSEAAKTKVPDEPTVYREELSIYPMISEINKKSS